ncbi:MAG: hypothetical protein ABIK79_11075 [Chloroflexota bacterium]|nr:hypothetical protein [Anaerolineae bacterium]
MVGRSGIVLLATDAGLHGNTCQVIPARQYLPGNTCQAAAAVIRAPVTVSFDL